MSNVSSKLRKLRTITFYAWVQTTQPKHWKIAKKLGHRRAILYLDSLRTEFRGSFRVHAQTKSVKAWHEQHPTGDYRMPVNGRMRGKHTPYTEQ